MLTWLAQHDLGLIDLLADLYYTYKYGTLARRRHTLSEMRISANLRCHVLLHQCLRAAVFCRSRIVP